MLLIHVEDDLEEQEELRRLLRHSRFDVVSFSNATDTMYYLADTEPDVVLIDFRLGDGPNGIMLAEQVRHLYPAAVIIMATHYPDFNVAVQAIQAAVDDFMQKPLNPSITDRIWKAVLKRQTWYQKREVQQKVQGLTIDPAKRTVIWHGARLKLTNIEYRILKMLISRPDHVFGFAELYGAARPEVQNSSEDARSLLKPHIKNLREKFEQNRRFPQQIKNVYGEGYKWSLETQVDHSDEQQDSLTTNSQ